MKQLFIILFSILSVAATAQNKYTLRAGSAIVGGGAAIANAVQEVTAGSAVTINSASDLLINHAAPVAPFTATLPATPAANQEVKIIAGTTVSSFTVAANTGQTLVQPSTPVTMEAGETISYKFYNAKWYRVH